MNLQIFARFNHTGIGRHAENFHNALRRAAGSRFTVGHTDPDDAAAIAQMLGTAQDDGVTIFFTLQNPEFLSLVKGRKIIWFVFESTRIPSAWRDQLMLYDAVWIPSGWGRDVLVSCGVPAEKITVMPEGVEADIYKPEPVAHDGFVFLSVGKYEKRKGIDELIRAFVAEFPREKNPDVALCLKADFPMFPQLMEELKKATAFDPRIRFDEGKKEQVEMAALYNAADAFVYPSRAEGFGLPCLEAIACGLPAVAVDYSAQMEYLREIEGLYIPVAYEMEDIQDIFFDHFFKEIYAGESYGQWAKLDPASLRAGMRQAYEQRDMWKSRAAHASKLLREKFDWSQAAERARAFFKTNRG